MPGEFGPSPEEMGLKPKEMKVGGEEDSTQLLSEKEALLYQEYATAKDGSEFGDKASKESYQEAEMFIQKLREANIEELQGINWDQVDLRNAVQRSDLEGRLDHAIRSIVNREDPEGISDLSKFFQKAKYALPLAVEAGLLLYFGGPAHRPLSVEALSLAFTLYIGKDLFVNPVVDKVTSKIQNWNKK